MRCLMLLMLRAALSIHFVSAHLFTLQMSMMRDFGPINQIVLWSLGIFLLTTVFLSWTLRRAQGWLIVFVFIISNYGHKGAPLYLIFSVLNSNPKYFRKFLRNSFTTVLMRVSFHDNIEPGFKNKRFNSPGLANSRNILKPPHLIAKFSPHQSFPILKALKGIMANSFHTNVTKIERSITNEGDCEKQCIS